LGVGLEKWLRERTVDFVFCCNVFITLWSCSGLFCSGFPYKILHLFLISRGYPTGYTVVHVIELGQGIEKISVSVIFLAFRSM
jgi:hypothetical protein